MLPSGFLLLDKPKGFTSHDVVAKARKALGTKKVGHAGTLDPMATGLLVLGFNQGTKLLTFAVGNDKTYLATIRLGAATVTDDAEGEVIAKVELEQVRSITSEQINSEIAKLTGAISQVPSAVSAIKVAGVRAYDRVRAGEQVELKSRDVFVSEFELLEMIQLNEFIDLKVRVQCSSGTYIRALARDMGNSLGVGGHLTELRRTRVGLFQIENAYTLTQLQEGQAKAIPLAQACQALMPIMEITADQALALRQGKQIAGNVATKVGAVLDGELVAILTQAKLETLKSVVVF